MVPRLKYQAYQAGCKLLSGIDYVGEGLANFLGITTPKYISESEMNAVYQGHPVVEGGVAEDNSIWNQNNNNAPNEVITRYPQPQSGM